MSRAFFIICAVVILVLGVTHDLYAAACGLTASSLFSIGIRR